MNIIKLSITIALLSFASFSQIASAQFWDSWTDTYSPTWTPLSLNQMTSKNSSSSSYKINTYQPSTSTTTPTKTPPADLLIPEGGKGLWINKGGAIRYLDDDSILPFGTKANYDTKEITFTKDYITFLVGTITHYNPGANSFGYIHPSRFEIDTHTYAEVSDSVKPPENFTVPEGAIGVRIKEWGKVQYLNNNMQANGVKGDFSTMNIVDALDEKTVLGETTVKNYKKYDNVDSFGYIFPQKLEYAFKRGKDTNGLPPPPADMAIPTGATGVRIGDWGSVYYLSDNTLVSPTALGKIQYIYNKETKTTMPPELTIIEKDANGNETEIGKVTNYFQDVDIYSYGYVYKTPTGAPVADNPPVKTPLAPTKAFSFKDVPTNASYLQALKYAVQNDWVSKSSKFSPNSKVTQCRLAEFVFRASKEQTPNTFDSAFSDVPATNSLAKYVYAGYKKGYWKEYKKGSSKFGCSKVVQWSALAKTLNKITGLEWPDLNAKPKKYVTKADIIATLYKAFGPASGY